LSASYLLQRLSLKIPHPQDQPDSFSDVSEDLAVIQQNIETLEKKQDDLKNDLKSELKRVLMKLEKIELRPSNSEPND